MRDRRLPSRATTTSLRCVPDRRSLYRRCAEMITRVSGSPRGPALVVGGIRTRAGRDDRGAARMSSTRVERGPRITATFWPVDRTARQVEVFAGEVVPLL